MHAYAGVRESEFAAEVRLGLSKDPKTLPCRYFYDAVGTALFQAISVLPEYGLTRADDRLIRAHAPRIAAALPGAVSVIELGSGDGRKTGSLLAALAGPGRPTYYPIDVSRDALDACRRALEDVAEVKPIEAQYLAGVETAVSARRPRDRVLVLFLGSTIGNFERLDARRFLADLRRQLRAGDALLLGADLVKSESRMLLAYDDPAGVTAAFNRNLLARINRELGADFDLGAFVHQARYDRRERRIEMHLVARQPQRVSVPGSGIVVDFGESESIWTESSHKFGAAEVLEMAAGAGFGCAAQWVDEEWPFAETLLIAR
jgi:dimethylhistidine N-methyltransferase